MESVHFVPDQCANFASHFSSIKIFQIDLFYFASHFIRVQIFQICFSLKSEKFLFPPPHYNFGIVQWSGLITILHFSLYTFQLRPSLFLCSQVPISFTHSAVVPAALASTYSRFVFCFSVFCRHNASPTQKMQWLWNKGNMLSQVYYSTSSGHSCPQPVPNWGLLFSIGFPYVWRLPLSC